MTVPKTLRDALAQGYTMGEATWTRGYVSRRADPLDAPVHIAGGSRAGQLYVLEASYNSTTYCLRRYLIPPNEVCT